MRSIPIPHDVHASHEAVLSLAEQAVRSGLDAHVRVVLARDPRDPRDPWRPAVGRIDLVRTPDPPPHDVKPKGFVRILEEDVPGSDFLVRLRAAMAGGPLVVCAEEVSGHGMAGAWGAYHHTWDWRDQGTNWPCVTAAPHSEISPRPHIYDIIEDDGPMGIFDGLEPLVRRVSGFRVTSTQGGRDIRFSRFQLVIWDYRGRFDRLDVSGNRAIVEVYPKGDATLKLVGLVAGQKTRKPILVPGPVELTVALGEPVAVAKFALKVGEDIVAEVHRDLPHEAAMAALEGRLVGPSLVDVIVDALDRALRPAFQSPPTSEKEIQIAVETILRALGVAFHREKERAPVGATTFIPDFTVPDCALAIEIKFAKEGHGEAAIQRELAQDAAGYRTKWSELIAVVYDCGGAIQDPERMREASESLGIRLLVVKH